MHTLGAGTINEKKIKGLILSYTCIEYGLQNVTLSSAWKLYRSCPFLHFVHREIR